MNVESVAVGGCDCAVLWKVGDVDLDFVVVCDDGRGGGEDGEDGGEETHSGEWGEGLLVAGSE